MKITTGGMLQAVEWALLEVMDSLLTMKYVASWKTQAFMLSLTMKAKFLMHTRTRNGFLMKTNRVLLTRCSNVAFFTYK